MTKNGNAVPRDGLDGLEEGEMSIAPLEDSNRNTNLDRARREFRPVVPRPADTPPARTDDARD